MMGERGPVQLNLCSFLLSCLCATNLCLLDLPRLRALLSSARFSSPPCPGQCVCASLGPPCFLPLMDHNPGQPFVQTLAAHILSSLPCVEDGRASLAPVTPSQPLTLEYFESGWEGGQAYGGHVERTGEPGGSDWLLDVLLTASASLLLNDKG